MRVLVVALVVTLLAGLGAMAPMSAPVARAAGGVKVVIVVGATHGATARYRDYANEIYAEAVKHTPDVVRVYSPNATAARVRAAVAGASIVVYLGHGNGWPSPYAYDPAYTTKNGFGLNFDTNGDGRTTDDENRYYGEPWIRELDLAPNAVVLLFHLCYASGNSEPGQATPTLAVARQRVDNYAAPFLAAGARAVVASGLSHHPAYVAGLFTTRQTIDAYWRSLPDANGSVATYASERTPGLAYQLDPEGPGRYYRSVAGDLSLRTEDVTGAPQADTRADPTGLQVPGNATPVADGTPVFDSVVAAQQGAPVAAVLTADTRVRVEEQAPASDPGGAPSVYRVSAGGVTGWMTGASLVPRDSLPPRVWSVDDGTGALSPDGDGSGDDLDLSVRLSEPAAWRLRIRDGDGEVRAAFEGTSATGAGRWAPEPGSVGEGTFRWELEATDAWGNGPLEAGGAIRVDLTPPVAAVAEAADVRPLFTPNGDGQGETVALTVTGSEPGTAIATVRDAGDRVVRRVSAPLGDRPARVAWDGRDQDGAFVPDGEYRIAVVVRDEAGNRSEPVVRSVAAYGALGRVAASVAAFFPQDGDRLARSVTFTFRLDDPATVRWTVEDAGGRVVRTIIAGAALAPGMQAFAWDGRDDAGTMVPRGTYRSTVSATDGTLSSTQRAQVLADAFRVTVSDTTPARGQRITVTAFSAELLGTTPRLRVMQPGKAAWDVAMRKVAARTWRVTISLSGGSPGTLRLRVVARDRNGAAQATTRSLPIR